MNMNLRFTVRILAVIFFARAVLCYFAEEKKSEISREERTRILCDLKAKPNTYTRAELVCAAKMTGSDLEKKKFTKKFEQLAGPELSKFLAAKNIEELETLTCADPKKFVSMTKDLYPNIQREGNATDAQFMECWVKSLTEMHYDEECVKKVEDFRKAQTISNRCLQKSDQQNCTEISKKMISNPEKASDIACASKATYTDYMKDDTCSADESVILMYFQCLKSFLKQ